MNDLNSLLEAIKALTGPVEKLIDSVSSAIGILYEPKRIIDKAQAEAEANIILTKSNIESEKLMKRAQKRQQDNDLRRQKNVESITLDAINYLPPSVSSEPVNEDWIFAFYDRAQDISDKQMQELWARILAGEISKPGSFSRRTLESVKMLSANEARLFVKCCPFVWSGELEEDKIIPIIILDGLRTPPIQAELTFTDCQVLQSAGLVTVGNFFLEPPNSSYQIQYFDNRYSIGENKSIFSGGHVLFTEAGKELIRMFEPEADREYEQRVLDYWRTEEGLIVNKL